MRTLTLTLVRTVHGCGPPRLLVKAGAAAVARLAAGVVLALALESGQKKKGTWSWEFNLPSQEFVWRCLEKL